ncbi:prepilin-type N-terminal cleavage/methylation domain-containing protein [Luteolibacter luteus]|uniref:Type II secretion system protein n=1 Tax=Luteolibacter luteus TaxID=2728835 RepID=A0A858RLA8_9BACT|nr:prepilin-type N-terminal cleavage/methylation domain-containing protein [Luteolibacter luteus]QJE97169.1 type II secretion system protein [Luteolibacter luteus]
MKTRPANRTNRGFTLVELLVVISIIVVLAAMSFGAANMAINKAKKLQSSNDANGLKTAIENYYQEYSKMPDFGMSGDEGQTDGQTGSELLTILLGKEEVSDSMQNKKQIVFLNAKVNKNKNKGGLVYSNGGNGATPEGLYDAWGNPFHIKIDDDYDGEITDPLEQGNIVRNKQVIVYSYGPDGAKGAKGKTGVGDDIKTW